MRFITFKYMICSFCISTYSLLISYVLLISSFDPTKLTLQFISTKMFSPSHTLTLKIIYHGQKNENKREYFKQS